MKKTLLIFSLLLFTLISFGQITVTNATFPKLNDTLKYYNTDAENVVADQKGGNLVWDFSKLKKENVEINVYKNPKDFDKDKNFTTADLCIDQDNFISYFKTKANAFERIGQEGDFEIGVAIPTVTRYRPARIEKRAPINFFDVNSTSYDLSFTFSTEFLPDSLLGQFANLVDSIRFSLASTRLDVVEAWGKCKIPDGEFDVLKEKRTEITESKLEAKTFFGWTDITQIVGGGGGGTGGGLGDLLGKDTIISYHFFNDKVKEEIAVISTRRDNTSARYKAIKIDLTSTSQPEIKEEFFTVAQNPIVGKLGLIFQDGVTQKDEINLTELATGRKIKLENSGDKIQLFDTSMLASGLFAVEVVSGSNRQVKVVVVVN